MKAVTNSEYVGEINVKNRKSTTDVLTYDGTSPVKQHLGGTVGELNKVVGGEGINQEPEKPWINDIGDLLAELTTGKRTDRNYDDSMIAGIDAVKLISVTSDSFTVQLRGWDGTYDTLMIEGDGVADIIADFNASTKDVDLKGRDSEFEVFTYDDYTSNFNAHIGGTSGELREIVGGYINQSWGTRRGRNDEGQWETVHFKKSNDLDDLFQELVTGEGRPKGDTSQDKLVGISGVELMSLTADTFVLKTKGWSGTEDTMVFTGEGIEQVIKNADGGNDSFDVKGWSSDFAIFDLKVDTKFNLRGDGAALKDVTGRVISTENRDGTNDVQVLLEELLHGERADKPDVYGPEDVAGIDGVELLGIDQSSFSIRFDTWETQYGAMTETLLFTNAEDIISEVMTGSSDSFI